MSQIDSQSIPEWIFIEPVLKATNYPMRFVCEHCQGTELLARQPVSEFLERLSRFCRDHARCPEVTPDADFAKGGD